MQTSKKKKNSKRKKRQQSKPNGIQRKHKMEGIKEPQKAPQGPTKQEKHSQQEKLEGQDNYMKHDILKRKETFCKNQENLLF